MDFDQDFDQGSGDIPPLDLEHKEEKGQVRFHSIDDLRESLGSTALARQ